MPFDSHWCCGKKLKGDAQNLRQTSLIKEYSENSFQDIIVDLIKCNVDLIAN